MMRLHAIAFAAFAFAVGIAPIARADYAVLRSGVRLHITGYENTGDRVRLTVQGGVVEMPASDIVSIEPEETFSVSVPAQPVSAEPYSKLIRAAAKQNGLDEKLIARVIAVESNFDPKAVSKKQARGLMQLLPETAARYAVANVFDPAQNIGAGTRYLKYLIERYGGNLSLALAAYNAGPDMVERYGGVPPFLETRNYIARIVSHLSQTPSRLSK